MPPKRTASAPKGPPKPKIPKTKPGFNDLTVILDTQILNEDYGSNLTAKLSESELKYQVRNQLIPQSVSFERETASGESDEEPVLLLILQGSEVVGWIETDVLIPTIKSYADIYPDKKISLFIYGFRKFLRGTNTRLSRVKIETELTRLQIHTKFSHRFIEKPTDLMDTIVHFSKSVAEIPIKKLKNDQEESENYYFANDNKDCVKVVDTVGLGRLWQQHLIMLPFVTLETAEAIMSVYPLPKNLLDAFKNSTSPETLLRDIPFRRAGTLLASNRRLGPEMSRKIYQFYHSMQPNDLLSN